MTVAARFYRGLEIYPLVFPHRPTASGFGHNYDEGFDSAVRILEPHGLDGAQRSRVFGVVTGVAFTSAGDARRASIRYAERLIDSRSPGASVMDLET